METAKLPSRKADPIKKEGLSDVYETNLAGAYGSGEHKSLNMIIYLKKGEILYTVEHYGKQVHSIVDLDIAIKFYNSL